MFSRALESITDALGLESAVQAIGDQLTGISPQPLLEYSTRPMLTDGMGKRYLRRFFKGERCLSDVIFVNDFWTILIGFAR